MTLPKAEEQAMLAPDSRALLLDALRPPPDCSLDRAVATTYTLDLTTALTIPLAFAGFRLDEQPDPIEIMEALRRSGERLDIFCQAGAISAEKWPSDLLALLENVVHEVRRPHPGHIFHPKVWVLRFLNDLQEPSFRLLVLSRNLSADRSWDTLLWIDGQPQRRQLACNAPLAQFVAALPELSATTLPNGRRAALAELAQELKRIDWELPDSVREVHFHPIGLPRSRPFPVEQHFSGYRKLAVSPFLRDGMIRRLFQSGADQKAVIVSRAEELSRLQPDAVDGLDAYVLDPTASLVRDDVEAGASHAFLTHLHAKLYVVERARRAHLFVGSANATDAGFGHNIEFLCELIGPTKTIGVESFVGEDAPFYSMLVPYGASEALDVEEEKTARRALDGLLIDIAEQVRLRTTVTKRANGWVPHVTGTTAVPSIPEGARVTIAPYNRPAETYELNSGNPLDFKLPPRHLADITPFLQITASQTVEKELIERSVVVCSQLEGAPDDRFQEILARQIDTPEKFLRFLALLIGFASGSSGNSAALGNGSVSWSGDASEGVLELLARALSENPESIDHLAPIVEHLRQLPNGRAVLPSGWDDVWLPAQEASQAMREAKP